jgi:hypothetical protein
MQEQFGFSCPSQIVTVVDDAGIDFAAGFLANEHKRADSRIFIHCGRKSRAGEIGTDLDQLGWAATRLRDSPELIVERAC